MTRLPVLLPLLGLLIAPAFAADPPPLGPEDSVVPPKIAGYELRVLDLRKAVFLNFKDSWVRASLPIFLYYPTGSAPQAAHLLRQIQTELSRLARAHSRDLPDLPALATKLESVVNQLEGPP